MNRIVIGLTLIATSFTCQNVLSEGNPFIEDIFISPDKYNNDPPVSGKMAADNCSACHGTQGRIFNEIIPPLAGMPKQTFVKIMLEFKEEKRPAIIMNKIARAFTDGEIERMGDYFAKQPAEPWLAPTQEVSTHE